MIEQLRNIPPLQKPHLSWKWQSSTLENKELATELARICHSVGTHLKASNKEKELALSLNPEYLAINFHFAYWFNKENFFDEDYYYRKLEQFRENVRVFKDFYHSQLVWLLDFEIPYLEKPDIVTTKLNNFINAIKEHYPDAPIIFYRQHAWGSGGGSYKYERRSCVPIEINTKWSSLDWYMLSDYHQMLTDLKWTHQNISLGKYNFASNILIWLALGSQYTLDPKESSPGRRQWGWTNNYQFGLSWKAGYDLNRDNPITYKECTEAIKAVKYIAFWPEIMEPSIINYNRHFLAYCQGAHKMDLNVSI